MISLVSETPDPSHSHSDSAVVARTVGAGLFVFLAALYVLLSWAVGSLTVDGHDWIALLVGLVTAFLGGMAFFCLILLVAPRALSRMGGTREKAVYTVAFVLASIGVPVLAWLLTN
jgi:hypothetical protein